MRVVLQRVNHASVTVEGKVIATIGQGILALVGFSKNDSNSTFPTVLDKLSNLRIFPNESGRFDRSLLDVGGELLLVPQFTLFADTNKGRRPDFFAAMDPAPARTLFEQLIAFFRSSKIRKVEQGEFGADMKLLLENDGPVTLTLEF